MGLKTNTSRLGHGGSLGSTEASGGGFLGYRRAITIDHTKVSATQTDFPVLVDLTDATLKSTGNGGHVSSKSGYDILFYADSRKTTALAWEIESYDPATGHLVAWVKIPSLLSSADTIFYLFYGGTEVDPQSDSTAVWNSAYKGVYHLSRGRYSFATPSGSNPIINYGGGGWKDAQVQEPCVFVDPADSTKLIMFYAAMAAPVATGVMGIGRATASVSNPTVWTEYAGNPIISDTSRRLDSVVYQGGIWYLYSTSANQVVDLFTSTDGITFTEHASSPVLTPTGQGRNDGTNVSQGSVIYDGGTWRMWYCYRNGVNILPGLRYATSSDGITWTKQGSGDIFSVTPGTYYQTHIEWSQALKIGSYYILTFSSFDGVDWTENLIYSTLPGSGWQSTRFNPILDQFAEGYLSATGSFTQIGSTWYLFYQYATTGGDYNLKNWAMGMAALDGSPVDLIAADPAAGMKWRDSTSNAIVAAMVNNGALGTGPMPVAGKVGGAMAVNNVNGSYLNLGTGSPLNLNASFTISTWIKPASFSNYQNVLAKAAVSDVQYGLLVFADSTWVFQIGAGSVNGGGLSVDTWAHLVATYDGTTAKVYLNGSFVASATLAQVTNASAVSIGCDPVNIRYFDGAIDEVRFLDVARSAASISTEHNNQGAPSTFTSLGDEDSGSPAPALSPVTGLTAVDNGSGSLTIDWTDPASVPNNLRVVVKQAGVTIHDDATGAGSGEVSYSGAGTFDVYVTNEGDGVTNSDSATESVLGVVVTAFAADLALRFTGVTPGTLLDTTILGAAKVGGTGWTFSPQFGSSHAGGGNLDHTTVEDDPTAPAYDSPFNIGGTIYSADETEILATDSSLRAGLDDAWELVHATAPGGFDDSGAFSVALFILFPQAGDASDNVGLDHVVIAGADFLSSQQLIPFNTPDAGGLLYAHSGGGNGSEFAVSAGVWYRLDLRHHGAELTGEVMLRDASTGAVILVSSSTLSATGASDLIFVGDYLSAFRGVKKVKGVVAAWGANATFPLGDYTQAPPDGLNVTQSAPTELTLTWTAGKAQTYTVRKRTDGGSWSTVATDQTGASYVDTSISAGQSIEYGVTGAVDAHVSSEAVSDPFLVPAAGSWTLVAHIGAGFGTAGGTTSAINTTGANLIAVSVSEYDNGTSVTLTDSKGNTWTQRTPQDNSIAANRMRMFDCASPVVGTGHTFTIAGANSYSSLTVLAFSGANATPFDQENGANFSGTSAQPGSVTPSVDNSLIIVSAGLNNETATPSVAGYIVSDTVAYVSGAAFGITTAYLIQATAAATNPTLDFGGASVSGPAKIATFKPA